MKKKVDSLLQLPRMNIEVKEKEVYFLTFFKITYNIHRNCPTCALNFEWAWQGKFFPGLNLYTGVQDTWKKRKTMLISLRMA